MTVSFETMPVAMGMMLEKIERLEKLLSNSVPQPVAQREPIEIDEACKILHKAKSTVYALCNRRAIPCYKMGNKLFFYKDELLAHIESNRRKTAREIQADVKLKSR